MAKKGRSRGGSTKRTNPPRPTNGTIRRDTDASNRDRGDKSSDIAQRLIWLADRGWQKIDGVPDSTMRSYRRGESRPGFEYTQAIIAATGCDPGWLLTGRGEPFPTVTDTPKTAAAMEDAFVSLIRQAGHSADAVVAIEPFVGREAIRSKITPAEIRAAARSLRDAGGQLLGLAGPPGEDE